MEEKGVSTKANHCPYVLDSLQCTKHYIYAGNFKGDNIHNLVPVQIGGPAQRFCNTNVLPIKFHGQTFHGWLINHQVHTFVSSYILKPEDLRDELVVPHNVYTYISSRCHSVVSVNLQERLLVLTRTHCVCENTSKSSVPVVFQSTCDRNH